ncbi:Protein of unknown function [Gryllus bimaculatus]|nr:Protein of unknown function [Gryllus bimaculatus]
MSHSTVLSTFTNQLSLRRCRGCVFVAVSGSEHNRGGANAKCSRRHQRARSSSLPARRGKRTRASRESREKAKRSYSEEEEGEGEEEEDTRIRWEDVPKLGHMLFPLLRPSPLTPLTRDTAAQQFLTPIASLT